MTKIFTTLIMIVFSTALYASPPDVSPYFGGKTGCFILYNLNKNAVVTEYNSTQCKKQLPPAYSSPNQSLIPV